MKVCPVDGVAVGPKATFCSGRCRAKAFRAARRIVRSECVECGSSLEQKPVGRPRIRCGSVQCETVRVYHREQAQTGVMWDNYLDVLAASGCEQEDLQPQWTGDYIKPAEFRSVWTVECDLDPLAYGDGWDAAGFVAECGRAGFPVGVTLECVPATLGAGCG